MADGTSDTRVLFRVGGVVAGSREIARFVEGELGPMLAGDFAPYRKTGLVRMHGPFVQLLSVSSSRGGALRVHPTFFVAGADLSLTVIPQNVSLEVLEPAAWSFAGATLNADLARRLVRQLDATSPMSFTAPIPVAEGVVRVFQGFDTRTRHWSASLYLAQYLLACGSGQAAVAVGRARARYAALGERIVGAAPPWRVALGDRIAELERRMASPDGQALCRAESERQAADLGLPSVVWP